MRSTHRARVLLRTSAFPLPGGGVGGWGVASLAPQLGEYTRPHVSPVPRPAPGEVWARDQPRVFNTWEHAQEE